MLGLAITKRKFSQKNISTEMKAKFIYLESVKKYEGLLKNTVSIPPFFYAEREVDWLKQNGLIDDYFALLIKKSKTKAKAA